MYSKVLFSFLFIFIFSSEANSAGSMHDDVTRIPLVTLRYCNEKGNQGDYNIRHVAEEKEIIQVVKAIVGAENIKAYQLIYPVSEEPKTFERFKAMLIGGTLKTGLVYLVPRLLSAKT